MKKVIMILMAVALVALPTMAQKFKEHDQQSMQFQSTSTMAPVNSQYSAQPMLNADGTAYNPATSTTPSGPRRATKDEGGSGVPSTPGGTEGEQPLGDAVLPLMLCAMLFVGVIYLRRRRICKG